MTYKEQVGTEYWKPEAFEEEVEGEIVSVTEGDFGKQYAIKKEDGSEITTPSHAYLQNRLAKCKVGDKVKLIYTAEEPPKIKGQSPMKVYKVFIDE